MSAASISQRALGIRDIPDREKTEHQGRNRLVTDDEVGDALRWLASNAREIGEARARMVRAGHLVKHTEALLFLASDEKTVDAKKASVKASQRWLDAAEEEAIAAGEFEKIRALREAAALRIEAWRTEAASLRSVKT